MSPAWWGVRFGVTSLSMIVLYAIAVEGIPERPPWERLVMVCLAFVLGYDLSSLVRRWPRRT